jgi:hypothetical protein
LCLQFIDQTHGGFHAQISLDEQFFQLVPGVGFDLGGAEHRGNPPKSGFTGSV